jgi:hypothetical protein
MRLLCLHLRQRMVVYLLLSSAVLKLAWLALPLSSKTQRQWSRLPFQFGQLLKSWIKNIGAFFIIKQACLTSLCIKLWIALIQLAAQQSLHFRFSIACKVGAQPACPIKHQRNEFNYMFPLLAMSRTSALQRYNSLHKPTFDTDGLDVGVNNQCSACISNVREHFIGKLNSTNQAIKGYSGSCVHNLLVGTMRL